MYRDHDACKTRRRGTSWSDKEDDKSPPAIKNLESGIAGPSRHLLDAFLQVLLLLLAWAICYPGVLHRGCIPLLDAAGPLSLLGSPINLVSCPRRFEPYKHQYSGRHLHSSACVHEYLCNMAKATEILSRSNDFARKRKESRYVERSRIKTLLQAHDSTASLTAAFQGVGLASSSSLRPGVSRTNGDPNAGTVTTPSSVAASTIATAGDARSNESTLASRCTSKDPVPRSSIISKATPTTSSVAASKSATASGARSNESAATPQNPRVPRSSIVSKVKPKFIIYPATHATSPHCGHTNAVKYTKPMPSAAPPNKPSKHRCPHGFSRKHGTTGHRHSVKEDILRCPHGAIRPNRKGSGAAQRESAPRCPHGVFRKGSQLSGRACRSPR
ncbi:hypothetical protein R3P38DRAFT_2800619 [Favolaschia claudopus]|uniref:Uncharacterized protein n=1 Tax=Favolaschia claudopus TaxID=2862362 RepID=A0AAV9ZXN0_9AGAR